jgi:hypothetical protein
MVNHVSRPSIIASALLLVAGSASAQGYALRTWGYYDPVPYGPVIGETYGYSPYRPTVTMYDAWGRLVDMPLRPKVLYYDTPFLTPQGWYRPRSIAVMPDSRPRYYPAPGVTREPVRVPEVIPRSEPVRPKRPVPPPKPIPPAATYPDDRAPANPVPAVAPESPAPRPATQDRPMTAPAVPDLPSVPKVPALPDVPRVPAVDKATVPGDVPKAPAASPAPALPKLGPSPMDIPPTTRPGG